eukprot:TRINITY_DN19512_c0_g2_i1.p1 TRINITY_DN19512_c0_g2~~TRINITY_DN19512_c0_g2_i1.p1  ORF type:complete len:226 (-),score=40.41 TRINITY_DN19512_c0_g2_i1:66-716(-)
MAKLAVKAKTKAKAKAKTTVLKRPRKATAGKTPISVATASKESVGSGSKNLVIPINRAPVLTLWITVCMRRLGYKEDLALTSAKVVCAWCAQAKGKSLGIFPPAPERTPEERRRAAEARRRVPAVAIAGMNIPVTSSGELATSKGEPLDPGQVDRYLRAAFKQHLQPARAAMERLANSRSVKELRAQAIRIYERFRPPWRGWGVPGELRISEILSA